MPGAIFEKKNVADAFVSGDVVFNRIAVELITLATAAYKPVFDQTGEPLVVFAAVP